MSYLNNSVQEPQLFWIIEPENKIRFRYESEGGSHGGLAGKNGKKTHPTLQLINSHGKKPISVRVSLYTEDKKQHVLDFKGEKGEGSKQYIEEKLQDDNTVEFKNLRIISKRKCEIEEILMSRKINNLKDDMSPAVRRHFEQTYKSEVKERARAILNSVRLYFEAFETNRPDIPLCTLFSDVISNQKAAAKGDLRICRLSHVAGSWKGGEEVILLCDKVQKENIKVKFYEVDQSGSIIWHEYGHFLPADVHYQYAIPFKTPPYKMNDERKVFICLERNGEVSEPREFTYKSERKIPSSKKRKLYDHQSQTVSSPVSSSSIESSESISSMSTFSPESDSDVQMQSTSDSHSNKLNQDVDSELSVPEDFDDLINLALKDEDCQLPFELIYFEDNLLDGYDASYIHENKDRVVNQSFDFSKMPAAEAQMCVSKSNIIGSEMDYSVPMNVNYIKDQNLDVTDIDVALRNFTLKVESKSDSEGEFKNCCLSKFLQNRSKDSKTSEISLHQKKQIINIFLLKKYKFSNTILHCAILANKNIVPILKMGHNMKVDLINEQNCKNQTALHLATERNMTKEVKILLQSGGNPNLPDVNGNNCYHIAAKNNFPHVLLEINKFPHFVHSINDFNDEGLTPTHIAIIQNNPEYLFELLKIHMLDSNAVEKKAGKSLLHYAVSFQPYLLSKLLEMANIDVDVQDYEGNTPLHIACANENIKAVKQLLQSRAHPLIKNFKSNFSSLETENSEDDDASDGQIPADLTTNTEILKLLRSATETQVEDPLNLQNSDSVQASEEIPFHIMEKLCMYLDDEMKWKKILAYFFDEDVVDSLNLNSSPTKALLDYVKKQEKNGYLERFKTALEFAELTDAVNILNLMNL